MLVDDGFSTWSLERDLDIVLLDARDPWGAGALLPQGRMREPRRAAKKSATVTTATDTRAARPCTPGNT